MSELKPCHNDLPDRLRWWAAHCDMTSCGCRISSLMVQAANTLERCDQPNQLLGPAKLIPMEDAITILESSNEALVVKMGELAGYIANIEEPDCDVDTGYDTLAYCQREYDAVQMVVDYVRRTQPNEPLTMEELRGIGDTPVWLVGVGVADQWVQIQFVDSLTVGFNLFGDGEHWAFKTSAYSKTVFAYHRKPEPEGCDG